MSELQTKINPIALYKLGISLEKGNEGANAQEISKAVDYFQRSYVVGGIDATYRLANLYLNGYGIPQDLRKACTLLNKASDKGYKEAYLILNTSDADGRQEKYETITKMLEKAAESGHVLAPDTSSSYYSIRNAIKWFTMVSQGDFVNSHYKLGLLIESNNPSEEEQQKAVSLYQMAAEKGHEQALFRLAQLNQNGTKRDQVEAFSLYTLAAQQGYKPAQLATCVLSEPVWEEMKRQLSENLIPGEIKYTSCLQMWEAVADKGNVELQYSLSMMYEKTDVDPSLTEATRCYSRAAECSHAFGAYQLGRLNETGRVQQDYSKAIKYHKIADGLGNSDALYQLGIIYQHGEGTDLNVNKAIDYYTQAYVKGHAMAQYTLGQSFEKGELLSKNIIEALKRNSISKSQGNELLGEVNYNLDHVSRRLWYKAEL